MSRARRFHTRGGRQQGWLGTLAMLLSWAGTAPAVAGDRAPVGMAAKTAAATAPSAKAPAASAGPATIPAALPVGLEASCDSRVQRHRLKNGVEVVLRPVSGLPAVSVRASVHVGSRQDPPGYEGLAHYVEHLTFRSVPGFASIFELYEEAGATGLNGSTALDTTDYYATVPSAQLERAIWIEARRMALGLDLLTEGPAEQEREVLQREHMMRFGKGVGLEATQAVYAALFPSGHPYHRAFANEESQSALTLSAARWFFARHYRPERIRLVLAGDFEPAAALALAERWFGGLTAKAEVPAAPGEVSDACTWAQQALAPGAHRLRVSTTHKNQSLSVYWPIAASEEPEQWRGLLRFVAQRLRQAGQQTGLAAEASVDVVRGELGHFYELSLPLAPAQPIEKAEPLLVSVLEEVRHLAGSEQEAAARSIDLWTRTGIRSLEEQTRQLAQRSCTPLACGRPEPQPVTRALAQLQRFELSRALIVERVYAPNAPVEGDVEVVQ